MAPQNANGAAAEDRYERHLAATAEWLQRSIERGKGGSCGYFSLAAGWSRPYPETTGYLIPTLLALEKALPDFRGEQRALQLGDWLLSIQGADGWWRGGFHPPKGDAAPSVFNTAQILQGLVALHDHTGDGRWIAAARRAARWLADRVEEGGLWPGGDYRSAVTPSYYSYAAWPMLEVAARCDDREIRGAAEGALDAIIARRRANGSFAAWGFTEEGPAFTHTIAYTLQGLVSSARVSGEWDRFGKPAEEGLQALAAAATESEGRLPGSLGEDWAPAAGYVCLTGNAQIALCLLDLDEAATGPSHAPSARLLVDAVCAAQRLRSPIGGVRGGVGGSAPIWGRYMVLRYPNWAAKYHCDALMRLLARPSAH